MAMRILINRLVSSLRLCSQVRMMGDELGSGSGKGGGAGGSVREAGGAFGKMEATREEEYFRRKQAEQLKALKGAITEEIDYHANEIKEHEDALARHKQKLEDLKNLESDK